MVVQKSVLWKRDISDKERVRLSKGPEEIDLVHSGLEDTMMNAYQEIRNVFVNTPGVEDLRTAAFICAINKIGICYEERGIFP